MPRTAYRGTIKASVTLEPTEESSTHFSPGLHENEHTEAVFEALDGFKAALRRCQNAEHVPGFTTATAA